MRHRITILLSFLLVICLFHFSGADEGMWMPHQMKRLHLEKKGLQMDPARLYKSDGTGLMSAVVYLGGGTGEFVSPRGLILTNHHVAFGALQRASDAEHDYIRDGFIAWKETEEIPAPGYIADVLLNYREVTDRIEAALRPDMTPRQRYDAIDKIKKQLIAEVEKTGPDIRARIASMYSGNQYFLYKFKRLRDIRIVYAPPRDLGNFGGDIDNWMWPRHTADFSFLRAYVSPNGTGAAYSTENVPYHPASHLKISLEGVKKGDFTFVMGYPGRTYRNYTVAEVRQDMQRMKERIGLFRDIIQFYENAGKENREIQIKYARILKGLNNALKNYQGKLEGMRKFHVLEKKKAAEDSVIQWIQANPERRQKYDDIVGQIADFLKTNEQFRQRQRQLGYLTSSYFGPALLSQAYLIYHAATERQKPDLEREEAYQERNLPYIRQRIRLAERGFDLNTDRAYFKHLLHRLKAQPANQLPAPVRELIEGRSDAGIDSLVDRIYATSILKDAQKRLQLLDESPAELEKLNDPLLNLAAKFQALQTQMEDREKELTQEHQDLKKLFLQALLAYRKGLLAPDANSTLRFTYGTVKGYSPRDAVYYLPQTTLHGVIEKDTGKFPFHVPQKIKELEATRDFGRYEDPGLKDVPACFLNTTNVTGGNSGSPTLNARGEQVGIIFDMTYESVIGDYYIIPALQRTISVDIRYVLFVTEKFSGATHIIKELGL